MRELSQAVAVLVALLVAAAYADVGTLMSALVPAQGGNLPLQFTVVLPDSIADFSTVASQSDTATIVFDTDIP